MGDGNLQSQSSCSARFRYSSKHLEYIQYIKRILESFGIMGEKVKKIYHKKREYYSYYYRSFSYIELLVIQKQWYPEGKKIVPRDLKLSSLTCRQWYIGDGSLQVSQKKRSRVRLCTQGFTVDGVKKLIKRLKVLGFKATRTTRNMILISAYSTKEFLNYIGNCPVECYRYKWNYQDNRKIKEGRNLIYA